MERIASDAPKQKLMNGHHEKQTYVAEHADWEDHLEYESGGTSPLGYVLGGLCLPLTLLCSWYTVNEKEHAVLLSFGKYAGVEVEPGCHFANCFGRTVRKIAIAQNTIQLPEQKIVDHNGNPLLVSAIVTYYVTNARKAALNVASAPMFLKNQAEAVMKQVVSRYPYETTDGTPSLKNEAIVVGKEMVELLQQKVNVAGTKILSFDLMEIAYAPEIAAGMLRRQQAGALVAARKVIVDGAVQICGDTIQQLKKNGVEMDKNEQARLVTNLLTVICADKDANPVVAL